MQLFLKETENQYEAPIMHWTFDTSSMHVKVPTRFLTKQKQHLASMECKLH